MIGGNARDGFTQDETVDVVGAFVGVHGFQVAHVPAHWVLIGDSARSEHVPGFARDLKSAAAAPTEGLGEWMETVIAGLGSADEVVLPEPLDDESIEELRSLGYVD